MDEPMDYSCPPRGWAFATNPPNIPRSGRDETFLVNLETGCMRRGPWICDRDTSGTIYFINLQTKVTQWLRPLGWMQGWVSRDARFRSEFTYGPKSHPKLSPDDARQMVEGGAPTEYNLGQPSYPRDKDDDTPTYQGLRANVRTL